MSEDELKVLQKDVNTKKRIASEWASQIHDLVEDRFLSAYHELPELARQAVAACEAWKEAKTRLDNVSA